MSEADCVRLSIIAAEVHSRIRPGSHYVVHETLDGVHDKMTDALYIVQYLYELDNQRFPFSLLWH